MNRYADHIKAAHTEQQGAFGNYVYDSNPAGLITQPIEALLAGRTLYRGGQQSRLDALAALASGGIFFQLRQHDTGHVEGRGVDYRLDFSEAVTESERLSAQGGDVTVHACAPGWGFPECALGRWSAGRLVSQSYLQVKGA